jgi:hypothetical protein
MRRFGAIIEIGREESIEEDERGSERKGLADARAAEAERRVRDVQGTLLRRWSTVRK